MSKPFVLRLAGLLAIAVALVHGMAAEYRLFPAVTAATPSHLLLLRFVWQASTLAWISFGVLLIAAPRMPSQVSRLVSVVALVNFSVGAIGGVIATGWTHYGWALLTAVSVLIAFGIPPKLPAENWSKP